MSDSIRRFSLYTPSRLIQPSVNSQTDWLANRPGGDGDKPCGRCPPIQERHGMERCTNDNPNPGRQNPQSLLLLYISDSWVISSGLLRIEYQAKTAVYAIGFQVLNPIHHIRRILLYIKNYFNLLKNQSMQPERLLSLAPLPIYRRESGNER